MRSIVFWLLLLVELGGLWVRLRGRVEDGDLTDMFVRDTIRGFVAVVWFPPVPKGPPRGLCRVF